MLKLLENCIMEMLNDKNYKNNVLSVAKDLINCLSKFKDYNEENKNEIGVRDFQFDLSEGKMKNTGDNTWFVFDLDKNTSAHSFNKMIYSKDPTEEESSLIAKFINDVANEISDNYSQILREIIRSCIIPDSEEWAIPMNKIKVMSIELVDFSSVPDNSKYLFQIGRHPDSSSNVNIQDIFNWVEKNHGEINDMKVNQIVSIVNNGIKDKNENLEGIVSFEIGEKYIWEVSMGLFVDYSLSDTFIKQQKNVQR